ncbi:MAG: divergent polysaccharide deacetylase family protein [Minisyncoccales bacterium]
MKKNKGISSIVAVLIILIVGLGAVFVIQKSTDLDYFTNSNLKFFSEENSEEKSVPDNNKEPKKKEDNKTPTYKVAIIIDDVGNNYETDKKLSQINQNLTLAVLPNRGATLQSVKYLSSFNNFQFLLHLPLEPIKEKDVEEDMIMTSMERGEIKNKIDGYLKELGQYIVGVNNHKGSKFTSDHNAMKILLEELNAENLFFVDSFTYKDSIAYQVAKEINIKTAKRDIFLDNSDNKEEIRKKVNETVELAQQKGEAIAIGHSKPNTITVLEEELKNYNNIEFVKVSQLLQ